MKGRSTWLQAWHFSHLTCPSCSQSCRLKMLVPGPTLSFFSPENITNRFRKESSWAYCFVVAGESCAFQVFYHTRIRQRDVCEHHPYEWKDILDLGANFYGSTTNKYLSIRPPSSEQDLCYSDPCGLFCLTENYQRAWRQADTASYHSVLLRWKGSFLLFP